MNDRQDFETLMNPGRTIKIFKAVHLALNEAQHLGWQTPDDISSMLDLIKIYVRDNPPSDQEIFSVMSDKIVGLITMIDKQ